MKGLSNLLATGALTVLLLLQIQTYSQENIGLGTDFPNADAIMEMVATDKGLLIPRLTLGQRNTNLGALGLTDEGMLIYNTTDDEFNYWDGTQWVIFPAAASDDADWHIGLGTTPPSNIADNIWTNGNVGIGLNNPAYALDIAGDLQVGGDDVWGGIGGSFYFHSNAGFIFDLEEDGGNTQYFRVRNSSDDILFRVDHNGTTTIDGDFILENTPATSSGGNLISFEGADPVDIILNTGNTSASLDIESQGTIDLVLDNDNNNAASEFRIKRNGDGIAAVNTLFIVPEDDAPYVYPYGTNTGETGGIKFRELAVGGGNFVRLRAPDAISANFALTLPTTDGAANEVLQTDGTGILDWVDPATFASSEWTDAGSFLYPADGIGEDVNVGSTVGGLGRLNVTSTKARAINNIQTFNSGTTGYSIYNTTANTNSGDMIGLYNLLGSSGSGNHIGVVNAISSSVSGQKVGMLTSIGGNFNSTRYGIDNQLSGSNTSDTYGVRNLFNQTGLGTQYGFYNQFSGTGAGTVHGSRTIIPMSGNGTHYGVSTNLAGTGSGNKYGLQSIITTGAGGTHYGVYSQALKAGSFAGYFLGNVYVGTTALDGYQLPPIDGTATYIMQTDGAGQASWVDPATLTADNDWTRNAGDMYPSNLTDDVGIGTNTPGNRLHVDGGTIPFRVDVSGTETMRLNNNTLELINSESHTLVGELAGLNLTGVSANNTLIGMRAGQNMTDGHSSAGVGWRALGSTTTGYNNSALGANAMALNTTGYGNVAIGANAMVNGTGAVENVAVGSRALLDNTGTQNVAVGYETMLTNTSGGNNTAIGVRALSSNTTASGSVAVGKNALASSNANNNTAVGLSALTSTTSGTLNVGMGNSVLQNNTTGGSNVAIGSSAMLSNSSGSENVAIGATAMASNTASGNVAVGTRAMAGNSSGTRNTALGFEAMNNNTTASDNIAIGYDALTDNTTGAANIAMGNSALENNTTANNNTAIGYQALFTQSFSNGGTAWDADNTAIGYRALYSNTPTNTNNGIHNTAVGHEANFSNVRGRDNTSLGFDALTANTDGDFNTAIGSTTLDANSTGDFNTAVGYGSLGSVSTTNNNTAIGYQAGGSSTAAGCVYVGYQAGQSNAANDRLFIDNSNTATPLIYGNFTSNLVGINCNNPLYTLHVNGSLRASVAINTTAAACSDVRYKKNVIGLNSGITKVLSLRPVYYEWKVEEFEDEGFEKGTQVGFIAQEMEQVIPEVVTELEDGYKAIQYNKLTPYLVKAIQEQQTTLEHQEDVIRQQEAELKSLREFREDVLMRLQALENADKITSQVVD